jgi:hypothetical protein
MRDTMRDATTAASGRAGAIVKLVLFWTFVGVPLLWGVSQTIANATKMFQ